VVTINNALELLSPDAAQHIWDNGPLLFVVTNKYGGNMRWGQLPNYDTVAMAITEMLTTLGEPLPGNDLQQNYRELASPTASTDGTILTVVYAQPVDLRSKDGSLLAKAKWVGIQWNRDNGKSNRLFYGNRDLTIEGGFVLYGDMTNLGQAFVELVPQP
jgi:hypothetical protein